MKTLSVCAIGITLASQVILQPTTPARELSFEQRVAAQRAIEQVYWSHRIWPAENPGPKPELSAAMSDAAIRGKVEDYLKQSNALATFWQRPITASQLQAEMNRMAANTHAPALLRELDAALGNDPFVIAETLARQTLVDRLIRNWYARDERFHGEVRATAEAALAGVSSGCELPTLGADYTVTTWRLQADNEAIAPRSPDLVALDPEAWRAVVTRLDALPTMAVSALEETDGAFLVRSVLQRGNDTITEATASWPKVSFQTWWAERSRDMTDAVAPAEGGFTFAERSVSGPCAPESWAMTSLDPVTARRSHTAVWTGSEMIVWGGINSAVDNTGGRYNPATDSWVAPSTTGAPAARYNHSAVWTGIEMIVWSGYGGSSYLNTGGRYNPASNIWVATTTTNAPSARQYHTAVWTGTEMIVWGGHGAGSENNGGRYNPSTDTWVATTTTGAPAQRERHTAVWTGSEMVVWGGITLYPFTQAYTLLNTGARYDPTTDTWVATTTTGAPTARDRHAAVWTGSEMVVWGGLGDVNENTGGRYNPSTDTWVATTTTGAPSARYEHTAVWTGTEMIVWGGDIASPFTLFDTGGRYNPSTDSWVATTTQGAPQARYEHTAVWTGSEVIIWGGYSGAASGTGGRYNPSTDSWVPTTTGGGAGARSAHTAVWTGSEMIVWGGQIVGTPHIGSRYDPATDNWVATTTTGAPDARANHSAVWTGSEMIVWGGGSGATLNTGGRYNPSTNSWVATTTIGAPIPRRDHSALWTGTQMIVWGGYGSDYTNTGGRYNPSTNSWVATTSTGAPTPRDLHAAVWTGSEMIIWGGYNSGVALGTGGRYNPSTDSWVPTTTGGGAEARYSHTAVWTGSEMIIWGGLSGGVAVGTGGRYNPATDNWVATSMTGAPDARAYHTAVWSGSEMIVWGGLSGNTRLDTGGRYSRLTDSWIATAAADAPDARYGHTAVWTGSEMIVWGGVDQNGGSLGTGGRYSPGNAGVVCREAAGVCDVAERCTGSSASCPADVFQPNGTTCEDGNPCTIGDSCSGGACAPGAPAPAPDEVADVTFGLDKTFLTWSDAAQASAYDVLRGDVDSLPVGPGSGDEICFGVQTSTIAEDSGMPEAGRAFWYVVRGRNACAVGSYGTQSNLTPRVSTTCP